MQINRVAHFINNNKTAQSVLKYVNDNPAVFNASSAFILASIARPSLIGILPFKDKKDKQYSQASSVAAGLVELGATIALFIPLNKSIQKASNQLYNGGDAFFKHNNQACRQFKSVTNRGIKVLSLIPISFLRFSIVKPIVNFMFGGKDGNK